MPDWSCRIGEIEEMSKPSFSGERTRKAQQQILVHVYTLHNTHNNILHSPVQNRAHNAAKVKVDHRLSLQKLENKRQLLNSVGGMGKRVGGWESHHLCAKLDAVRVHVDMRRIICPQMKPLAC